MDKKRYLMMAVAAVLAYAPAVAQPLAYKYLVTGTENVLQDGMLYRIPFDELVLNFASAQNVSPLSLDKNSVAAIELRRGQKIEVSGSDAQSILTNPSLHDGRAYPGISIPGGATLVVFGEGEIIAHGGNAENGFVGGKGGDADLTNARISAGDGGPGGKGGAGSAPGIGGISGTGGEGAVLLSPNGAKKDNPDLDDKMEEYASAGTNGHDGGDGSGMGRLIVLGNVRVTSVAGKSGQFVYRHAMHGTNFNYRRRHDAGPALTCMFKIGYGGGGGNGGSGDASRYDIGGGAPGAGGGGAGAGGGIHSKGVGSYDEIRFFTGAGGLGGESFTDSLSGRHGQGVEYHSVKGGKGGNPGRFGDNGSIYVTGNVELNATYEAATRKLVQSADVIPDEVRQYVMRKIKGASWNNAEELTLYYGQEMPDTKVAIPTNSDMGSFCGYFDPWGKKVYDAQGNLALAKEDHSRCFDLKLVDGAEKWYLVADEDVELTARWGGMKDVYIIRYMENANYMGNPANPDRYLSTMQVLKEHMRIPNTETDVTLEIPLYDSADGKTPLVDANLFAYAGSETDKYVATVKGDEDAATIELKYDAKRFNLSYEGLDDDVMSRTCDNLKDYTRPGAITYGKALNLPQFHQSEGKVFDHWEYKTDDGSYAEFQHSTMTGGDVVLRPVFATTRFHASLLQTGMGTVSMEVQNGTQDVGISQYSEVDFHETVNVKYVCAENYRCKNITVLGADSNEEIETTDDAGMVSFRMPDEDVTVKVDFEYHPFCTLDVVKATEGSNQTDKIVFYATKDWKTFYTDNNDYYGFNGEKLAGRISDMSYSVGEQVFLHTDFLGDTGARQPRLFVIRDDGKKRHVLDEVARLQTGRADTTLVFFTFEMDSALSVVDTKLQLQWMMPRTQFRVNVIGNDNTKVKMIYANGRNVRDTGIAYKDEQVDFTVDSKDDSFDINNISISYWEGFTAKTISPGINAETEELLYNFIMPGSDVVVTLNEGSKYSVLTETETPGYAVNAPTSALAGHPVVCNIYYDLDSPAPADEDIVLYVNGEVAKEVEDFVVGNVYGTYLCDDKSVQEKQHMRTKVFIMPKSDAYVSVGSRETGVKDTFSFSGKRDDDTIYNLLGQRVAGSGKKASALSKGLYIKNGKKYYNK